MKKQSEEHQKKMENERNTCHHMEKQTPQQNTTAEPINPL